jgi:hypothetical protein
MPGVDVATIELRSIEAVEYRGRKWIAVVEKNPEKDLAV